MIEGIRFKVCGLTSLVDAEAADRCGADYLGFNLYSGSARYIPLPQYQAMAARLPERTRVAVCVDPDPGDLAMMREDFDFFQIHFPHDIGLVRVAMWAKTVGLERLWLAPKLPPGVDVPAPLLRFAKYFLFDTFHAEGFGGSGRTGDWPAFARHQKAHPQCTWILAGGLNAENIGDALRATDARFVDVNSGVESSPGIKDAAKLRAFTAAMRAARRA